MTSSDIMRSAKTIAVVGLSDQASRPSHDVANQLMRRGYTIIPVNPRLKEWHGIPAFRYVSEIPSNVEIDIVDIFRRSEATPDTVRDILKRTPKPRCIWLQSGIINAEARQLTEAAGILYIEDECTAVIAAFAGR